MNRFCSARPIFLDTGCTPKCSRSRRIFEHRWRIPDCLGGEMRVDWGIFRDCGADWTLSE